MNSRSAASVVLGVCGIAIGVGVGVGFAPETAQARKFDFKSESVASYFRGSFGPSNVGGDAFAPSSGVGTSVDKTVATNASAELGFLFSTRLFNLRLGAEYLMPRQLIDVTGTDAVGTKLFSLNSKLSALVPTVSVETMAFQTATSRMLIGAGIGAAFITLDNAYTMTADGTSALGVADFVESASTNASMYHVYVGYEILFTDTVTAAFDLGYRYLPVKSIASTKDTVAITGSQTTGADLANNDGSKRAFDLGGIYAGLAFRFYIGL